MSTSSDDEVTTGAAMRAPSATTAPAAAAAPAAKSADLPRWDARRAILRLGASILGFFGLMALLAKLFGPRIEALGQVFVERFGLAGMAVGTFVADAFSLPPPPIFYIVIAATGSTSRLTALGVIAASSMLAGFTGYHLASLLAARPFFRRRIDATRARMDVLFERYGVWAFAIASATPLPFSVMCYVAGIYRVRPRLLLFVLFTRVPRLAVMYLLVRAGWITGGG